MSPSDPADCALLACQTGRTSSWGGAALSEDASARRIESVALAHGRELKRTKTEETKNCVYGLVWLAPRGPYLEEQELVQGKRRGPVAVGEKC